MSELQTWQRRVASAIRYGNDALPDLLAETASFPRVQRLGIYADAYLLRLDEALRSNYPKLHLLLGDDDFLTLTRHYLAQYPSQRPSIRPFGDQLAGFLAQAPGYAGLPILAELARFEWALGCAFDAADAPTAGLPELSKLADEDWPDLRPRFQPSLRLLTLEWNTVPVWQALDEEQTPPAPEQGIKQGWAVWRQDLQPRYRSLAQDEATLLLTLLNAQSFSTACERLSTWHPADQAPIRAASLLGAWLNEGWVSSLS